MLCLLHDCFPVRSVFMSSSDQQKMSALIFPVALYVQIHLCQVDTSQRAAESILSIRIGSHRSYPMLEICFSVLQCATSSFKKTRNSATYTTKMSVFLSFSNGVFVFSFYFWLRLGYFFESVAHPKDTYVALKVKSSVIDPYLMSAEFLHMLWN